MAHVTTTHTITVHEEGGHTVPARVVRTDGLAGQVQFDLYNVTGGLSCSLIGSVYGTPGPIVIAIPGWAQIHVMDPARYGPEFNLEWVQCYFGPTS